MKCARCLFKSYPDTKIKFPCEYRSKQCMPEEVLDLCIKNHQENKNAILSQLCDLTIFQANEFIKENLKKEA